MANIGSCCKTSNNCPPHTISPFVSNKKTSPIFNEHFDILGDVTNVSSGNFSVIRDTPGFSLTSGVLEIPNSADFYGQLWSGFIRNSFYNINKTQEYKVLLQVKDAVATNNASAFIINFATAICAPRQSGSEIIEETGPASLFTLRLYRDATDLTLIIDGTSDLDLPFLPASSFYRFGARLFEFCDGCTENADNSRKILLSGIAEDDFFEVKVTLQPFTTYVQSHSEDYQSSLVNIYIDSALVCTQRIVIRPYAGIFGTTIQQYRYFKPEISPCLGTFRAVRHNPFWYNSSRNSSLNSIFLDNMSCAYI